MRLRPTPPARREINIILGKVGEGVDDGDDDDGDGGDGGDGSGLAWDGVCLRGVCLRRARFALGSEDCG